MEMEQEVKHIKAIGEDKCLCYKCLQKKHKDNIISIKIGASGYGSHFDNLSTQLQLCNECYDESQKEKPIWNMEIVYGEMHFTELNKREREVIPESCIVPEYIDKRYRYDSEMSEFISVLPIQSRELIYNRYGYGAGASFHMDSQDWIDYELGILSHEKCKEYGFYSQEEITAYRERFPKCQHPVNIIYDGWKASKCPMDACGDYGQVCKTDNFLYGEYCYKCPYYMERITPIRDISSHDEGDYMLYAMYQLNKEELERKFGGMN